MLFVLYREALVVYGKTLAANAGGRGFECKICFSHFTLLEWNGEELFCKTNKNS